MLVKKEQLEDERWQAKQEGRMMLREDGEDQRADATSPTGDVPRSSKKKSKREKHENVYRSPSPSKERADLEGGWKSYGRSILNPFG